QDLKQPPPCLECPNEVGEYSGIFLDLRYLVEEGLGVMAGQGLGLGLTDELYDVVVAGLAQLLLGPEVMDDQPRGDPGVFGDGTHGNTEPPLTAALDGRITDAGAGSQITSRCSTHVQYIKRLFSLGQGGACTDP